MDFFTIIVFLLLLFPLVTLLHSLGRNGKQKLPPGPTNLPFIGNLHRLGELPQHSLHKLSRKYGPIMYLKLGSVPTVVASSADAAKEFMRTHDRECCSRPSLTSLEKFSYGFCDIAFAPYGEQWRELRKICILELFSSKKVASFRAMREEEVEIMIGSISCQCSEINLRAELLLLANNITSRTALGKRYYGGASSDGGRFEQILRESQHMSTAFFFADYIPTLGWLDAFTGMRARLEKNFHDLDAIYQQVINNHRDPTGQGKRDKDAIDSLLDTQKKTTYLTDNHIKGTLMNIFMAGSETSSAVLEWAMAELMRNSEAMKRAQNEVRDLTGKEKKKKVEECDLDQLHYLKLVVKETLRLHPPAPLLLQRETMKHCKVNGYDIPAKTRLLINAWAIGRDGCVWERPNEFYPERFIDSPLDFTGHDFQFIPFGAGRRICPGMISGILVVELALANLLYFFDWKLPNGMSKEDVDMGETRGLTAHRRSPLHLRAMKYLSV